MDRPKAFKKAIMRTVEVPVEGKKPKKVREPTGKFGLEAKCTVITDDGPCKRYGRSVGQNEHGIVMKCRCGELFIADAP